MTAEQFLEKEGIPLSNIAFVAFLDGYQRLPDLCVLMEKYYEAKSKEQLTGEVGRLKDVIKTRIVE